MRLRRTNLHDAGRSISSATAKPFRSVDSDCDAKIVTARVEAFHRTPLLNKKLSWRRDDFVIPPTGKFFTRWQLDGYHAAAECQLPRAVEASRSVDSDCGAPIVTARVEEFRRTPLQTRKLSCRRDDLVIPKTGKFFTLWQLDGYHTAGECLTFPEL